MLGHGGLDDQRPLDLTVVDPDAAADADCVRMYGTDVVILAGYSTGVTWNASSRRGSPWWSVATSSASLSWRIVLTTVT